MKLLEASEGNWIEDECDRFCACKDEYCVA
jgi:hypothetical protein